MIYFKQGKLEVALECNKKVNMLEPSFAMAWFNSGLIHEQLGKREDALKCYSKAAEFGHERAARKIRDEKIEIVKR